jgi:NhaA family Na+:H+ antiporter
VPLALALAVIGAMALANRRGVSSLLLYAALGIGLAALFARAGLHTTLAGVVTGLLIPHAAAVAVLAGIGFTMSLFIGFIALDDATSQEQVRLGVLTGSFLSAAWGAVLLMMIGRRNGRTGA